MVAVVVGVRVVVAVSGLHSKGGARADVVSAVLDVVVVCCCFLWWWRWV